MPTEKNWKDLEKKWKEKPSENFILREYHAQHPSPAYKEKNIKVKLAFYRTGIFGFVFGLLILCLSMGGSRVDSGITIAGISVIVISILLVGIAWIIYQSSNTKEYKKEYENWSSKAENYEKQIVPVLRKAVAKNFQQLYYCHRDDVVFLPETDFTCRASDMQTMPKWIELGKIKS